jgi:hypothetical protein
MQMPVMARSVFMAGFIAPATPTVKANWRAASTRHVVGMQQSGPEETLR